MYAILKAAFPYVAAIAAAVCVFIYVREMGAMAERQKQTMAKLEAAQADVTHAKVIAADLEGKLATLRAENDDLTGRLQDEKQKYTVYHTCSVPTSGVQLLTKAMLGQK